MHPKRAKELENSMVEILMGILEHEGILEGNRQVEDGETFFTFTENGKTTFLVQILAYSLRDDTAPIEK